MQSIKNPIDLPVKRCQADLSDKDAIDAIVKDLPGEDRCFVLVPLPALKVENFWFKK